METPVRQKTFGSWRSWAWVPVGAVTAAGVLFVTTAGSGAAVNVLVHPREPPEASGRLPLRRLPPSRGPSSTVLVVGDSLSRSPWDSGCPRTPPSTDVVIRGRPLDGCGLVDRVALRSSRHRDAGNPGALCPVADHLEVRGEPSFTLRWWPWSSVGGRPWTGSTRERGNTSAIPPSTPTRRAQFEMAVSVLSSSGARVALMTSPYLRQR